MAQKRPNTLSATFKANTVNFDDDLYLICLREMETVDPFTLTEKEEGVAFLQYCAHVCRAALVHAAVLPESKIPTPKAADMAANCLCALYSSHRDLMRSTDFSSLNETAVAMELCKDLADEFRDVDTARGILSEMFLREHNDFKLDAAEAVLDDTASQSSIVYPHPDAAKIFDYVCAKLYNTFYATKNLYSDFYAQQCLYFFVIAWIHKHYALPIEEPFFCQGDGPYCKAMKVKFERWRAASLNTTKEGVDCLDGIFCKEEIDEMLDFITCKALEMSATEVCDLSHKEGPWRAGILDDVIDPRYMLEYYQNDERSEAMRVLELTEFLRPRKRARRSAAES